MARYRCSAQITMPEVNTSSPAITIQYFVPFPTTPITSPIIVNGTMSVNDIQLLLNNDPVRISSGFTITVISFTSAGLVVSITKTSGTNISGTATGTTPDEQHDAPFLCRRRSSRVGGTIVGRHTTYCLTSGTTACCWAIQANGTWSATFCSSL